MVQILRKDKMIQLTESMLKNWLEQGLYTYEGLKETFELMITDKESEIEKLINQHGEGVRPSFVSTDIVCLHSSIHNYTEALKMLERIKK
tara:strand:- start:5889 stop:6158 length:270 start_codon:yes stop_codon:yes gene_type:complete